MDLPPYTNELVSRVLAVNPNAAIVVQSGTPVEMPWANQAKALVHAWYGGNETGNGIADVIYGDVCPVSLLTPSASLFDILTCKSKIVWEALYDIPCSR
jgi:beta-glucosidase